MYLCVCVGFGLLSTVCDKDAIASVGKEEEDQVMPKNTRVQVAKQFSIVLRSTCITVICGSEELLDKPSFCLISHLVLKFNKS